ncbi:MAG: hypothetical protein ACLR1D_05545 [Dialister sp.]
MGLPPFMPIEGAKYHTTQGRMELSGEGGTLLYAAHKGNVNALSGENVVYSGTVAGELKGSLFHMSKGILARAGQAGGFPFKHHLRILH